MISDKTIASELLRINAGFSIRYEAPTYVEDPITGKPKQVSPGCVHCDIFDLTVRETYATAKAEGEQAAVRAALESAKNARKPLTPAQKADLEDRRVVTDALTMRAIRAEQRVKDLENQIAAGGQGQAPKTPKVKKSKAEKTATTPPTPPAPPAGNSAATPPPVKRKPGRPRKNPEQPAPASTAPAAPADPTPPADTAPPPPPAQPAGA